MSTHIEILLNAVFGEEAAAVDLTVDREGLVFVVGPSARDRLTITGIYARKTLHRLAAARYLADQRS